MASEVRPEVSGNTWEGVEGEGAGGGEYVQMAMGGPVAIQSRGWGQISAWDMASSSVREGVLPPIDDPAGLRAFGPHSIEAGADAPYTNFSSGCLVRGASSEVPPLSPSSGTPAVSDDSLSASSTCAPLKLRHVDRACEEAGRRGD